MMKLMVTPEFRQYLSPEKELFDACMELTGTVYRQIEGRETLRLVFSNQAYFIKKHRGIGWREIFKNLLRGKKPVISARNEWIALQQLTKAKVLVPEVVAYGERGKNPAKRESFIITREVTDATSVEEMCKSWVVKPPPLWLKHRLIQQVAFIIQRMHRAGINHRDCYLCHFLLKKESLINESPQLYLIDLHRAQCRASVPRRWQLKDLSGIYFSAMDVGLTQRDCLRFFEVYYSLPWPKVLKRYGDFLNQVVQKSHKLYKRNHGT